jgi:hypothetical protein
LIIEKELHSIILKISEIDSKTPMMKARPSSEGFKHAILGRKMVFSSQKTPI